MRIVVSGRSKGSAVVDDRLSKINCGHRSGFSTEKEVLEKKIRPWHKPRDRKVKNPCDDRLSSLLWQTTS